jgi:hypothetical protein
MRRRPPPLLRQETTTIRSLRGRLWHWHPCWKSAVVGSKTRTLSPFFLTYAACVSSLCVSSEKSYNAESGYNSETSYDAAASICFDIQCVNPDITFCGTKRVKEPEREWDRQYWMRGLCHVFVTAIIHLVKVLKLKTKWDLDLFFWSGDPHAWLYLCFRK